MMKLPFKERVFLSVVVTGLAAVLVALAVLQYHWSTQVSNATMTSLQANLSSSMMSWREDLNHELVSVFTALQANPMMPLQDRAAQYAQQYQSWSQTAPHPNLVSHIFLLEDAGTQQARLFQLNTATSRFDPAEWPKGFENLRTGMEEHSANFIKNMHDPSRMHRMRSHDGFHPGPMGGGFPNRRPFAPDAITIDLSRLAMVRQQILPRTSGTQFNPSFGWIMVTLDEKVLQEHILPELAERYFSGSEARDYEVAVVASPGASLIYTSDPGFGKQDVASLDGTIPIFGMPRRGMNPPPPGPLPQRQGNGHRPREVGFSGPMRIVALPAQGQENDWQLLARHRKGSLEAVVAGMKRRNLTLSFGVLLVLAGGIAIILVSSQRARVLARLQMDFVAGVSHELRTPLAVISSAAENIADGVVASKQQLSQYGTEIKNQARQLMQLVEEILLFAATREKRHHYNLRPLRVEDVIDAALKGTAGLIESSAVTVEQDIAPNLPPVVGDLAALSHCLQNLITNAVKYGGEARWIGIKAEARQEVGRMEGVQISVEDKGLGISPAELRRIFEPFYRSRAATAAQIHGTGLGLSLAREIADAMGGKLTVSSEPGKGSCFTVYLPFADLAELQTARQTAPAANPKFSKT